MNSKTIVVLGSSNMDMVAKTTHIPVPGETVLAGSFFMNPGGKGANQAVTAARLGGKVTFISKVGNDVFGKQFVQLFEKEGIDTSHVIADPELPSGVALITVDRAGENVIVVASGANANLMPQDITQAIDAMSNAGILLMQLETPMESVEFAAKLASAHHLKIMLNPAPFNNLSPELLSYIDIITPNRTEAEMISGIKIGDIDSAKKAAQLISEQGVKSVVITMGSMGSVIYHEEKFGVVPAEAVDAVDTTGAGDVFNGALAVALSEGKEFSDCVRFASVAAAISVTRMGAQASIPYRKEMRDSTL